MRYNSLLGLLLGTESSCLDLSLLRVLGNLCLVLADRLLLRLDPPLVEGPQVPSSLESLGSNETLDFGGFGGGLAVLLGHLTSECQQSTMAMCTAGYLDNEKRHPPDNVFSDIVLLGQVEEFPDLGSTLGTQSVGEGNVGEAGNVLVSGFGDGNSEDSNVVSDDASTNGLVGQ